MPTLTEETRAVRLPAECPYCPEWRTLADNATRGMANAGHEVDALRAELATAYEIIGAMVAGGKDTYAAARILRQLVRNNLIKGEYTHDEARIAVDYFEQSSFDAALQAARAWLRREAK